MRNGVHGTRSALSGRKARRRPPAAGASGPPLAAAPSGPPGAACRSRRRRARGRPNPGLTSALLTATSRLPRRRRDVPRGTPPPPRVVERGGPSRPATPTGPAASQPDVSAPLPPASTAVAHPRVAPRRLLVSGQALPGRRHRRARGPGKNPGAGPWSRAGADGGAGRECTARPRPHVHHRHRLHVLRISPGRGPPGRRRGGPGATSARSA